MAKKMASQEGKEAAEKYLIGFFEQAKEETPDGYMVAIFLDRATMRLHKTPVKRVGEAASATGNPNFLLLGVFPKTATVAEFKRAAGYAWKHRDDPVIYEASEQ